MLQLVRSRSRRSSRTASCRRWSGSRSRFGGNHGFEFGGRVGSSRSIVAGPAAEQGPGPAERLSRFEFEETHMASPFKIVLYSTDAATARRASRAAYDRIAALERHPERLRPRKRALATVAIGRRPAGAGQRRPVRRARALQARSTSDQAVRSTSRSPRSAGSGGGPAATTSCRTPRGSPRPGRWSAPTRWCSTRRRGPSSSRSRG